MHNNLPTEGHLLIAIDPHHGIPVYRQIVEQVRFLVASGRLTPGDELPSTRALSAELGVNPMTVSKAYGLLEEDGTLTRRPGLALVVREQTAEAAEAARHAALHRVLDPVVRSVRQLGLTDRQAIEIFRRRLAGNRHLRKEASG